MLFIPSGLMSRLSAVFLALLLSGAVCAQEESVASGGSEVESLDESDLAVPVDEDPAEPGTTEPVVAAENIDLSEPVAPEKPEPISTSEVQEKEANSAHANTPAPLTRDEKEAHSDAEPSKPANTTVPSIEPIFVMLGKAIMPGTTTRLAWTPEQQFDGIAAPTPVLVAHGTEPGPKLCLTAALHGDELTGIEVVRRVMYDIDASKLKGTVIGVPIVNLQGFLRSSRYLADRRDLNRFFPGSRQGSSASRIAYSFFKHVIRQCDLLVDMHTGSFYRTNLPQLRADLTNPDVLNLTQAFDAIAVLHSNGAEGTLRRAAVEAGIPAVTMEAGGPMELDEGYVTQGVKSVNTLLDKLGMYDTMSFWGVPQPAYYRSLWVRANQGGILFSDIKLGAKVRKGDLLGKVTDPITNVRSLIYAPVSGRVIGIAINQVVLPGFAAYHIGIDPKSSEMAAMPASSAEGTQDVDEEEEAGGDTFD